MFKQENIMLQFTFNPGLTLTGFQTTRPWSALYDCGSIVANPIIYRLIPCPSLFENKQLILYPQKTNHLPLPILMSRVILHVAY